jgi:ABC-type polysaccharide/polyol phosphate transport system ATPase subunit
MSILTVRNVGKRYKSYKHQAYRFLEIISGGFFKRHKEKWVLNGINLDVEKGQSIGIVGRNGAGKSTLLKIITGTTQATTGIVECNARIAAILELGMGFDYELTGRQNAVIGMHLLGINGTLVLQKVADIEEFSELDDYFDAPIRVYSSGMLVRLAFSIATASDPDILIVDEALSVGDAYFQQKCAFVIEQYKRDGGTLLFVSHDPNMIKSLCDQAILIDKGQLMMSGVPRDVIDFYQSNVLSLEDKGTQFITPENSGKNYKATSITTNGDAELEHFSIEDEIGNPISVIESECIANVKYSILLNKDFTRPAFGLIIRDRLGKSVYETSTFGQCMPQNPISKGTTVNVEFKFTFNLFQGHYSFSVGVSNNGYARCEFEEISLLAHDVFQIQVLEAEHQLHFGGVFNMRPQITVDFQ